jgi:hypothetical protein
VLGAEDHERLVAVAHLAPHRVGARDVRDERAARALVGQQLERDVVRVEAAGPAHDQRAERVLGDQRGKGFGAGFGEMLGQVHRPIVGQRARTLRSAHRVEATCD